MADVADLMVREGLSFSLACQSLGIKFSTAKEEIAYEKRSAFQARYWHTYNRYNSDIGENPDLSKSVVMGVLQRAIVQLEAKREYDKIATAAKVLSDIAGWTKPETSTPALLGLSQAELDSIQKQLKAKMISQEPSGPEPKEIN